MISLASLAGYNTTNSSMLNIPRTNATAVPPTVAANPQATSEGGNKSRAPPNAWNSPQALNYYTVTASILFSFLITI